MAIDDVNEMFNKRLFPWVMGVTVASVLTALVVHLAGGSDHAAAVAFLVIAAPGCTWIVVRAVVLGRRLGKQQQRD